MLHYWSGGVLKSTGFVRGYTAPEYVSNGQLTEKADIYAFGVLIVEIVCGKKNSDHIAGSTSLLHSVRLTIPHSNRNLLVLVSVSFISRQ